ncbi:DUF4179 domain-containing protein [Paenibacillus sp. PL91]|uniref:DUF4179 domain-containing protein n=1 Tax=Paenibacillus sp. PL91 TaxID=2729538 RepID=UPI00145E047D|nr:DUF4179 domain-containing protein [Paenibacillus sp. PL91]MBC9204871.1 DUF4179 domain-containing protein [Paenibacillus sp. PL91]
MNAEKEPDYEIASQRLRSDKEHVEMELEKLPDQLLDDAIRRGLEQGRKRVVRGKRKRMSLTMIVSALSIFLLLTAFVRVSPAFAGMLKDIPGFTGYVDFIQGDKSLLSAVENKFFQPVNLSDEKNGYKFTVEDILADDQRLVILYTAEGPGINNNTGFLDFELKTSDCADLMASIGSSHFPSDDAEGDSVPVHDYLDVLLGDNVPMPESLQFSLLLGDQWLRVEFPIEHERFAGMREDISIEQPFEVGGQRFTVKDAIITPLQISLSFEADPNNNLRANDFINVALVDEKGRRYETDSGYGELNSSLTRHFKSSYFERPKKLTLVAEGVFLSEHNLSLTIDTDKMETISSPDNRLQLVSKEEKAEGYEIKLDLLGLNEIDKKASYNLFAHEGIFKDASGATYPISDSRGVEWNSDEDKVTHVFRIPKADFKQPLTFDIEQFIGYVLKPISIPIK